MLCTRYTLPTCIIMEYARWMALQKMKQCRIRGKLHFIMLMKLQCLFLDYFIWIWSLVIQEYRKKTIAYKYFCILPIFARQNKVCILICNKLQFIFWIKSIATFIDMYFIQIMHTAWSNFSSNRFFITVSCYW